MINLTLILRRTWQYCEERFSLQMAKTDILKIVHENIN